MTLAMDLHLELRRPGRLALDAYHQLREAILDGRLRPGERLPATRELAARLSVSRNTLLDAYQRLGAEGFLTGRVGAGTFVAAGVTPASPRRAPTGRALVPRPFWASLPPPAEAPAPAPFDFQLGVPDPTLFPWDDWRGLVAKELRGRHPQVGSPLPGGEPRLREAIARHLGVARSVVAGPEDVVVTSGAQQALDLIARVLLAPGDCVAVEEPGYTPAWQLLRSHGARVVPVPVDAEGLKVSALPDDARLVYVTPSHQFPLGVPLSLGRRLELLAWSRRRGAALVEDDYDSEFRFDGRPLEPLQNLDRQGRVLYVGTFSKVLLPGLRLGFVIAPGSLTPALRAAKGLADAFSPPAPQRALAAFMEQGLLARQVRRSLKVYGERRRVLRAALEEALGTRASVVPGVAGLHLSLLFTEPRLDVQALARRALALGVAVQPLDAYYRLQRQPGLALGYGAIKVERIPEGVRRLASALTNGPSTSSSPRRPSRTPRASAAGGGGPSRRRAV